MASMMRVGGQIMEINRNPSWYHFWNPYSGFIGGSIGGLLILVIVVIIKTCVI